MSGIVIFLITFLFFGTLQADVDWDQLAEEASVEVQYPTKEIVPRKSPEPEFEEESSRSQIRKKLLDAVSRNWERPILHRGVEVEEYIPDEGNLRSRLEQIEIPRVEFKRTPLRDVIEVLSVLSEDHDPEGIGINIVLIDPENENPQVSILLRQLNLLRVLEFILESVGFSYDLVGDAVVVQWNPGPKTRLETEFFSISRSTIIRLTGLPDDNVRAEDPEDPYAPYSRDPRPGSSPDTESELKQFLQRAGVPFDGIDGANLALADSQLIITQTPAHLDKVRTILQRYSEIRQVEIEARFLEVQDRSLEELGFEWSVLSGGNPAYGADGRPVIRPDGKQALIGRDLWTNGPTRNLANAFQVGGNDNRLIIDRPGFNLPDLVQGAPSMPSTIDLAAEAGNLAELSGVLGDVDVNVLIRALERKTGSDLLSSPKVTVLSGKTAEITVAQEFRYPRMYGDIEADVGRGDSASGSAGVAITAGTPRDFAVRNIGVEMSVTPTVEDDNAVSLRLEPTVTEFEGFVEYGGTSIAIASDTTVTVPSGFYQPVFSVRRIQTEVTIWDGATVIMGGLTREQAVQVTDKIPLLGSIPLIGRLFRSEGESTQKRNLLIFVTANLISPGGSPARQRVSGIPPGSQYQKPYYESPAGEQKRSSSESIQK